MLLSIGMNKTLELIQTTSDMLCLQAAVHLFTELSVHAVMVEFFFARLSNECFQQHNVESRRCEMWLFPTGASQGKLIKRRIRSGPFTLTDSTSPH